VTVGRSGVDKLSTLSDCESWILVSVSGSLFWFELCRIFGLCHKWWVCSFILHANRDIGETEDENLWKLQLANCHFGELLIRLLKLTNWFYVLFCFVDRGSRYNRVKKHQLDAQLILSIFREPLHVSDVSRPIIRRYNRMYTTVGTYYSF
jgi:hypothetical protein